MEDYYGAEDLYPQSLPIPSGDPAAVTASTSSSTSPPSFSSGIANIPNQAHYLSARRPLQLNVLLFGEAALGKTGMLNSVLGQAVFGNGTQVLNANELASNGQRVKLPTNARDQDTTGALRSDGPELRIRRQELDERGVRVHLNLLDVPELGQTLRKQDVQKGICQYVHEQHLKWLETESKGQEAQAGAALGQGVGSPRPMQRTGFTAQLADTRIHVVLYFMNPANHKLSDMDIAILTNLTRLTNVILVVAKADTLLRHELHRIKYNVRDQLRANAIRLFKAVGEEGEAEPFVCLNGDLVDGQTSTISANGLGLGGPVGNNAGAVYGGAFGSIYGQSNASNSNFTNGMLAYHPSSYVQPQSSPQHSHPHLQQPSMVHGQAPSIGRSYPWGFVRRTQSNIKLNAPNSMNELSNLLFRAYLPGLLAKTQELYEVQREEYLEGNAGVQKLVIEQREVEELAKLIDGLEVR